MEASTNVAPLTPKPSFFIKGQPWAPAAVSGVMIATALPTLLLGPFAGVLVDRWDKRLTMVRMDMVRAVLILLLIPLTGLMPLPFISRPLSAGAYNTIYVVTGLLFIVGAFYAMVNLRGVKAD